MEDKKNENPFAKKDEDEKEKEGVAKSLPEETLAKALDKLEIVAKSLTAGSRQEELLSKSLAGSATDAEKNELASILRGEKAATVSKAITENVKPEAGGALAKSMEVDVSGALDEMVKSLTKALAEVGTQIEKSSRHEAEVGLMLAKSVIDTGRLAVETHKLVKSLAATVEEFSKQPARSPKGVVAGAPIEKSGGSGETNDSVEKSELLDIAEAMLSKGQSAPCGEDLLKAIAKIEHGVPLSDRLMGDFAKFRAQRRS